LGGVFICYRREDSAGFARLIYDRLTHKLGHESVFFDVDNIPPGLDFVDILSERVGQCDALIAVIGKNWASSRYLDDQRRLDDPNDFVRVEIEAALARKIRVIPILVDGTTMPRPDDLPDSLKKLTRRQGIEISHTRFDSDVERLTRALSLLEEELRQREAAESERVAREERDKREAAEAVAKAEQARQLANAEAERAIEEQRAREVAIAERVAREEREAEEAAEKAEQARKLAEVEAARRAAEERRAAETAEADGAKRAQVESEKKTEAQQPRSEAVAAVSRALFEPANAVPEPPSGPALGELSAKAVRPSGLNKVIIASIVGAVAFLAAVLLTTHFESSPNVPATTTARTAETSPPAPNAPSSAQAQHTPSENCFGEMNCFARLGPETEGAPPTSTAPSTPTTRQAQYAMGSNYEWGRGGVKLDYQQAMNWYRKAADQGYADGQYQVGSFYEYGLGVGKDNDQAKVWYQKAADQGNEDAKAALRQLDGGTDPEITPTAPREQYEMAFNYQNGYGGLHPDLKQALYWYRKAADQGYANAQYALGQSYEIGQGVERAPAQAQAWYQKAADQGFQRAKNALKRLDGATTSATEPTLIAPTAPTTPQAQYAMGANCEWGYGGVKSDYQQAMNWYRKAADQGYADAQFKLGWLYENGLGIEKDYSQAKAWYQKAADQGNADAKEGLKRLDGAASTVPSAPLSDLRKHKIDALISKKN
jgi:TPR repeat protein